MAWQRRLWTGLNGLIYAELIMLAPFGLYVYLLGLRVFVAWDQHFIDPRLVLLVAVLEAGVFILASWASLCLPLLVLRGRVPRPASTAKLAGLGFLLGCAAALFLQAVLFLSFTETQHWGEGRVVGMLLSALYPGAVCALAMYFYVKLSVRQTLKDMRAAAMAGGR